MRWIDFQLMKEDLVIPIGGVFGANKIQSLPSTNDSRPAIEVYASMLETESHNVVSIDY
jgi:hypothetical protein